MSKKNSTENKKLRREAKDNSPKIDFVYKGIPVKTRYGTTKYPLVKMPATMFK